MGGSRDHASAHVAMKLTKYMMKKKDIFYKNSMQEAHKAVRQHYISKGASLSSDEFPGTGHP